MAQKKAGAIRINEAWCKRCDICIAFCPRDLLAALTQAVPMEALERAVLERVPRGTEELNLRALRCGEAAGLKEAYDA